MTTLGTGLALMRIRMGLERRKGLERKTCPGVTSTTPCRRRLVRTSPTSKEDGALHLESRRINRCAAPTGEAIIKLCMSYNCKIKDLLTLLL